MPGALPASSENLIRGLGARMTCVESRPALVVKHADIVRAKITLGDLFRSALVLVVAAASCSPAASLRACDGVRGRAHVLAAVRAGDRRQCHRDAHDQTDAATTEPPGGPPSRIARRVPAATTIRARADQAHGRAHPPISVPAVTALERKRWRLQSGRPADDAPIIGPMTERTLHRWATKRLQGPARAITGRDGVTLYTLRHTHASLLHYCAIPSRAPPSGWDTMGPRT